MPYTATFYNVSWPQMVGQLEARGYGAPRVQMVTVRLEAEYGPVEYEAPPFAWMERLLLIVLIVHAIYAQRMRRY